MDLFDKLKVENSVIGRYAADSEGYYLFPKLEGPLGPRMKFLGKERLNWSLNNYLGLGNHPEVRKADADAAAEWGMAYPMGARMLSGHTKYHEQLEQELAAFVKKESAYLLNYGYQGMVSIIDSMVDRHDVVVYDSEAHACILDGMRLHVGKRFVYPHNDMENLEKQLQRATKMTEKSGGGILLITEGVYGMTGGLGHLKDIVALKEKYNFRILIDDAHGFGTMGPEGRGTHLHYDVGDEIDVYFGTFAKSMAGIGGFVAGNAQVIQFLQYSMRSQIYAKSLPMPMVIGALKRLDMIRTRPELLKKLWTIVDAMQQGLREAGFNIGQTESMVTPVILAGGVTDATQVTYDLRENYNIFCSIVTYPVVPKGIILLRIIPTADHTLEDVEYTINSFKEIQRKLTNKEYSQELKSMNLK